VTERNDPAISFCRARHYAYLWNPSHCARLRCGDGQVRYARENFSEREPGKLLLSLDVRQKIYMDALRNLPYEESCPQRTATPDALHIQPRISPGSSLDPFMWPLRRRFPGMEETQKRAAVSTRGDDRPPALAEAVSNRAWGLAGRSARIGFVTSVSANLISVGYLGCAEPAYAFWSQYHAMRDLTPYEYDLQNGGSVLNHTYLLNRERSNSWACPAQSFCNFTRPRIDRIWRPSPTIVSNGRTLFRPDFSVQTPAGSAPAELPPVAAEQAHQSISKPAGTNPHGPAYPSTPHPHDASHSTKPSSLASRPDGKDRSCQIAYDTKNGTISAGDIIVFPEKF